MKKQLLLTGFIFLTVFAFASDADLLTANVASKDITPPLEMKYTLGGYGERMNQPATAIHDRIRAKALVLKQADRKYAILTLDLLGLPSNFKTDLIKRLSHQGWSENNIMLLPSHSHGSLEMAALNSKNSLNIPQLGIFQPELLEFLLKRVTELVIEADKDYQPVKTGTKSKLLDGLNRNRRKDPDIDKELIVTRIDLLNGKPLAVLVNWTAHPTFLGSKDMMVSAEWPGYLQEELQNMIGGGVTVLYYNGAEGDQSAVLNESASDGYRKIEIYGKQIAANAYDLYQEIKPGKINNLDFRFGTIRLPPHQAHPSFMKTGGEEYGMTESTVKIVMDILCPASVGIGAVRIGDLIIAGVPGEMTAILGKKIKTSLRKDRVSHVAIGGLANEWISYILDKDQYINGEGYESSVSFYGPTLGPLLSDEIIRNAAVLTE
ncbi:MAG TPA: neutral/alkaline non-lysosomal ceramidase N-terminal domain-containing protein [Prolixibacteraceae bacterium]|nr:neutral/alkaline non-lysosomal ceramidase N-terminal domain-containing protein [Prolixibacteraceae bacterium]